jgi:hypothetical protein
MGQPADRRSAVILAAFALLLGAVATRFPDPGVPAHSHWCPDPVLVGVDFYPPYIAAHALRAGQPIYDNLRGRGDAFADPVADHPGLTSRYTYPPPLAYLTLPLSWFPAATAWKIRSVLAIAGLLLALGLLTRLGGGGAGFALALAAAAAVFYPLYFVFINGNVALFCFVLLVSAVYAWTRPGSDWLGAGCLALAIVVKLYPALFLVYLAIQRRWRLLAYTCLALLAIIALTASGGAYPRFLERAREFDRFVQAWYLNASAFAVLMMRGVSFDLAYWAAKAFAALVLGIALLAVRRPSPDPRAALFDCGVLSAAMILAPNTNYDYNLIFLLPGVAAFLASAREEADGAPGPLTLAAVSFAALAVPSHAVQAAGLAANKFPWLLLFFAALLWRRTVRTVRTVASPT